MSYPNDNEMCFTTITQRRVNPIKEVYVLKLKGGNIMWVKSFNIRTRLIDHMNGRGMHGREKNICDGRLNH